MANFDFGDELKKLMLAGVGAAAETSEKAGALLDHLVKKGEITVEQGKAINEELKRNIKDCVSQNADVLKTKVVPTVDGVMDNIKEMSKDEIQALKEKLAALDPSSDDHDGDK
ncbi:MULTISPECIES: phasin family protein [Eubacterium]|uniref:Polyhydroxyalkanoate synthesis regulator phasin n=1 Tax=Eubacterium barkeri TaxID=1528 RepID=A0A1H3F5H2_EUBBA|nr:phasin family protein [Eubacterium barkeri]SDX86155.1 Polyhydroxyalkanoate synthesis regulator phasin [Eubacterium barkeri]